MPATLFVVHGSHPCATVRKAFELKGVDVRVVELPPPSHAVLMRLGFPGRTVPGVRFADGERVQGSTKILRALERRVPEPRLFTSPEVKEAERWGEEVLQPIARRVLWPAFGRHPEAIYDFQEGQRAPKLPRRVVLAVAPAIVAAERRLNQATDEAARADLQALPDHLDRIDAWLADGLLGGEGPNAADLQIAPTLGLLATVGDVRALIAGRPAEAFASRWFEPPPGAIPAGVLPPEWLPAAPAPAPSAVG
jgi:glutathione S-transferase